MKILIDARMYGTENGGIGRYVSSLVTGLMAIDKRNNYILLLRKKYYNEIIVPEGWGKRLVDIRHYSFKEQVVLPGILRKENADIVHFPHFNIPIMFKGKYVVTIHDMLMHKRTGMNATTLPFCLYLVKRLGYKKTFSHAVNYASKIIVPTDFVKQELTRYFPGKSKAMSVIYEGVDKKVKAKLISSAYIRKNKIPIPYFLYVGSVYPHKNVERLIEAIGALNRQSYKKIHLVVVTPRNVFQKRLNDFVKKHNAYDYVVFTGFVSDDELAALYKNAVSFVYPSKEEGFGLPGLEAMANETLVLASDIPVFREIYKNNAVYFNPYDFSSIQKAMADVMAIENARKSVITKRAKKYATKFSWEENCRRTLALYEET